VCVLANGIPLALNRLPALGPGVASHLRYSIDFAWLIPLLVCLAYSRRFRFRTWAPTPSEPSRLALRPRLAAVVITFAAAYVALSTVSAVRLQRDWVGEAARTWESNLKQLNRLAGPNRSVVVANDVVPAPIATFAVPLSRNNLAAVLPHYLTPKVHVDGALVGPLMTVDQLGRPHPAELGPALERFTPPGRSCSQTTTWPIASPPESSGRYYVQFAYTANRTTNIELLVDDGFGLFASPGQYVAIAAGRHTSIGWLGIGSPHALALKVPAGAACVTDATIVTVHQGV
jgi:hypothetical protein